MSNYDDRLKDYVDVKERVRLFYEKHPDGRLVTVFYTTQDIAGDTYVVVGADAYRTSDDPHPSRGHSWMKVPGSTPYTRGSEIENAETSAWGRAIGALGIGIDKSIASGDEVRNKAEPVTTASLNAQERERYAAMTVAKVEDGLIGIASLGKTAPVDGQPRQTPDGMSVGFVIGEGREKVQVVVYGERAEAFAVLLPTEVVGKRVQVFGPVTLETMKVNRRDVQFNRVRAERIVTPEATFAFPDEPVEAPSAELFTGPEFDRAAS